MTRYPIRLEMVEGTAAKFWEVSVKGTKLTTTWGRLGSAGQSKTEEWKYAEDVADRYVSKKELKGYKRVFPGALAKPPKPKAKALAGSATAKPAELKLLAKTIAARAGRMANPRFSIKWDDAHITGGDIVVGDPAGSTLAVANEGHNTQAMFHLVDKQDPGGQIVGFRIGKGAAATWQQYTPVTIKKLIGGWMAGMPAALLKKADYLASTSTHRGRLHLAKGAGTFPSLVGLDAAGAPACVLIGGGVKPEVFGAKSAGADPFAPPDTSATEAELAAIAKAIDKRTMKVVSKRFHLEKEKGTVAPVGGKLMFGDPNGPNEAFAFGGTAPVTFARLVDQLTYDDGYGKPAIIARLRDGAPVAWKEAKAIEMASGYFGFWSPGYPTAELDETGTFASGKLGAWVHDNQSSTDDGTCHALIGLDAKKRPVCLIFGEGVDPKTFARGLV